MPANGAGSAPVSLQYSFPGLTSFPNFSFVYGRDFKTGTPSCTIASGVTCSLPLTFQPRYPGIRQDALLVRDQAGTVLGSTLLHGIGQAPQAVIYPGIITTYAGTGNWSFFGDTQLGSNASFRNPQGIAVDPVGNVFIADSVNQVIREVSIATGTVGTVAGMPLMAGYSGDGGPATEARLQNPVAIAIDGAGNLYIADQGNNVIRKISAVSGIITTIAGGAHAPSGVDRFGDGGAATNALLSGPSDVALDAAANLYIADAFHGLIRRVDAVSGSITAVAGGGSASGTDGFGDGAAATQAQLSNPSGIAVDAAGNLYIADTGHSLVRFVSATSGLITAVAGNGSPGYSGDSGLATTTALNAPSTVRVDAAGNIYIADSGNDAIRKVEAASGNINTIAGNGVRGYYGDGGVSTAANLANPSGIALDSAGTLYIADQSNNVIRKVAFQSRAIAFGNTNIGLASEPQLLNIENIGNSALNFSAVSVSANFRQQFFSFVDCSASSSVAPGSSCTISVAFVPTTTFSLSGNLAVTTNALNLPGSSAIATLNGTGVFGPVPKVALSAVNLTFGNQVVGGTATLRSVVVTNSGNAPLGLPTIRAEGPNSLDFTVTSACGKTLAASASCTVTVAFTPSAIGARSASLLFNDLVANAPQTVTLAGTGILPARASLDSTSLNFAVQAVGSASVPQTVTLTSSGGTALSISGATLSGQNAADFRLTNTCSGALAVGASCKASVTFSPSGPGTRTALLNFAGSGSNSAVTVMITGTGIVVRSLRKSKGDFAVWRPAQIGTWFVIPSDRSAVIVQQYGLAGDIPVRADYDGDGKSDFAVWRPSNGTWYIISSRTGQGYAQLWGLPGDIPVPGDYDGDGKADFALWRPYEGTWYVIWSRTGQGHAQAWGLPGDIPVPGDYDGDGKSDFAVWRPYNGTWYIISSRTGLGYAQPWGLTGDIPVPGDFDGDGKTDAALWRPSNATWYFLSSRTGLGYAQPWGLTGDIPISKDFDGDGKTDFAVWRPANGTWYVIPSSNPVAPLVQQWGLTGDIPQ
jgi:sugar lactone lactonase YvrE